MYKNRSRWKPFIKAKEDFFEDFALCDEKLKRVEVRRADAQETIGEARPHRDRRTSREKVAQRLKFETQILPSQWWQADSLKHIDVCMAASLYVQGNRELCLCLKTLAP